MIFIKIIQYIKDANNKKAEIIRFGVTGVIATCLQYGLYVLFVAILHLSAIVSTVLSYGLSFCANFFLSNFFTFRTSPNGKKAVSFTASHLINLGLQTGLVAIFSHFINPKYALLPAMAICIPCNFFLVRFALKSKLFESADGM